ncbi:hypothetical protein ACGF5M_03040 [Gemmatimonadota bacterium]
MTIDFERLRSHYGSLSDEELEDEHARGPEAFANLAVWGLVEELHQQRLASRGAGEGEPSEVPTDLIEALCDANLEGLTKKGGVREGLLMIVTGVGGAAFGLLIGGSLLGADISYADVGQDLGGVLGWFVLLVLPVLPLLPYVGIIFGVLAMLLIPYGIYKAIHAARAPLMQVSCPQCGESHEISRANLGWFPLNCRCCWTLIQGNRLGHDTRHKCTYCDFSFFGGPMEHFTCPACRYDARKDNQECSACGQGIPAGVLFCRSCSGWIGAKDADLSAYDVTSLGEAVSLAYISALIERIDPFTKRMAEDWERVEDHDEVVLYGSGGFASAMDSELHHLGTCVTVVQFLYATGRMVPQEVLSQVGQCVQRLAPVLEGLLETKRLVRWDRKKYSQVLKSAGPTVEAAIGQQTA